VLVFQYVTTRTRFGRHIFAVGGNAEAARRAGISIRRVRVAVFMLASTMAAVGGIMAASRLLAVNQSSGGSDLLLLAIAGPVVAGTSLFGGRGGVWTALLGAVVIGSISNGMDLLALESSVQFIVTGAVLLAAVIVMRSRASSDRRRDASESSARRRVLRVGSRALRAIASAGSTCVLTVAAATTAPASAMTAATSRALDKPFTNAWGVCRPPISWAMIAPIRATPSEPPELARRVQDRRAHPGAVDRDAAQGGRAGRRHDGRHPDAAEQHAGCQVPEALVHAEPGEVQQLRGEQRHTAGEQPARSDAVGEPTGEGRDDDDRQPASAVRVPTRDASGHHRSMAARGARFAPRTAEI
jgi:hypothetical protein